MINNTYLVENYIVDKQGDTAVTIRKIKARSAQEAIRKVMPGWAAMTSTSISNPEHWEYLLSNDQALAELDNLHQQFYKHGRLGASAYRVKNYKDAVAAQLEKMIDMGYALSRSKNFLIQNNENGHTKALLLNNSNN